MIDDSATAATPCAFPHTGLGVLTIEGPDSTAFLDGQSSIRPQDTPPGSSRPGLFADARGRVLAIFRTWRGGDGWRLLVAAGEDAWLQAYLARYVFRAQVRLSVRSEWALLGLQGAGVPAALAGAGLPAPRAGEVARQAPLEILGLSHDRWLAAGPEAELERARRALGGAHTGNLDSWRRARFAAGEPEMRAATRGRFLPQMLGPFALGAVQFDKGCYPGQEVIARAQHRGRIKRRLALLDWPPPSPESGSKVRVGTDTVEVLDAVAVEGGRCELQAIIPWPPGDELNSRLKRGE